MHLQIELKEKTRTCWTPTDTDPDALYDVLHHWNNYQFDDFGNDSSGCFLIEVVEVISELPGHVNAGVAEVRTIEIRDIGSILAWARK